MGNHMRREERIQLLENMIREGQDYVWSNDAERRIWRRVAIDILKEHIAGKKTTLSEACFRSQMGNVRLLLVESPDQLNEGFFSGLADLVGGGLAKTFGKIFGGTKSRNWWIFGGGGEKESAKYRQAYEDAISDNQELFAKLGNQTVKELIDQVQEAIPDWPNGGETIQFTDAMTKFTQYYDSIRKAAGAPGIDGSEPPKNDKPKISVEDANVIIKKLRKAIQFFDRELKDRYTYNLESRASHMPTLAESMLSEVEEDDVGAEGRTTSSMKGLKSNVAVGILAGLGLGATAAGLITSSDWFIKMTSTLSQEPGQAAQFATKALGNVTSQNGDKGMVALIQNLNPKAGVTWNSSAEDLFKAYGALNGKPTVEGGLEVFKAMHSSGVLGKGVPGVDQAFAGVAKAIGAGNGPKNIAALTSVMQSSGTHKLPLDKLQLDVGPIVTSVQTAAAKAGVTKLVQGPIAAKLTALGPWGVGIGVGLIASAAAIKSLRSYGAKNSRTSYFQAAIDQFKDIKPDEVVQEIAQEGPTEEPPVGKPETIVVEIPSDDQALVKCETKVVKQGGFIIAPMIPRKFAPVGDKPKIQAAIIKWMETVQGKYFDFADGVTIDDVKKMTFEIDDKRQKKERGSSTTPGKGPVTIISIKDSYVPSLTNLMFEDAHIRTPTRSTATASKALKDFKKKLKADPSNLPVLDDTNAEEMAVIKGKLGLAQQDFTQKDSPGDDGVKKGFDFLKKKSKSGNVVLTFNDKEHEMLKVVFELDEDQVKKILKIYAQNPAGAPKLDAYNEITAKVPDSYKKDFKSFLIDMGIAIADEAKTESTRASSDLHIMERWQKLAGLID
jgi:hypothetical protein